MQRPVGFARTIPELDVIFDTNFEEILKFLGNSYRMSLIRVGRRIKDPFHSMDRVSDDNDVLNIWNVDGLINLIPDGKQLSLGGGNVGGSMNNLDNRLIVQSEYGILKWQCYS